MYQFVSRLARVSVLALGAVLGLSALPWPSLAVRPAVAAGLPAAEVDATYKITLNGFDLGNFRFGSNVDHERYTLDTDVELSALLGVFHWKGTTRSTGTFAANKPKPQGFLFEFASSAKSGSVKMGFGESGVEQVTAQPVMLAEPDEIPLTSAHLKGVIDPLTAIMAMTHTDAANPCGHTYAIFDGKQRFDLDLVFARQQPLAGTREIQQVCRVKYHPIAGYAPTPETSALANSDEIEIAFRPVPQAHLMLPQSISVPTPVGQVQITLAGVTIRAERGQVASVD